MFNFAREKTSDNDCFKIYVFHPLTKKTHSVENMVLEGWIDIVIPNNFKFTNLKMATRCPENCTDFDLAVILEVFHHNGIPLSLMVGHEQNILNFLLSWYMFSRNRGGELIQSWEDEVINQAETGAIFDFKLMYGYRRTSPH